MFGFSITKLLFTAAAIFIVWWGFKWVARMQDQRAKQARVNNGGGKGAGRGGQAAASSTGAPAMEAEDMVACKACGTFVAAKGARSCGRNDCPYPG